MKYVTAILESIIQCDCSIKDIDLSLTVFSEGWDICTKCPTLHLSLHEY